MVEHTEVIHKSTQNHYWIMYDAQLKINGEWIRCVVYMDASSKVYVRPFLDFEEKFELANK